MARYAEAERVLRQALEIWRKTLDAVQSAQAQSLYAQSLSNLALVLEA
jgi:hypothetical protein